MVMQADKKTDMILHLMNEVSHPDLQNKDDVRQFVVNFTKLIWDYKIIGEVYHLYNSDIEYHKQDWIELHSPQEIAHQILDFTAAFPDLTTDIEHIIVYKVNDNFYKVFRRLRYKGTNLGFSSHGPATKKDLGEKCLNLSLFHLKRIDQTWIITFEVNSDSANWISEVETLS